MRLEAPATYGIWGFERWETVDRNAGAGGGGAAAGTSPVLDVSLAGDLTVRAVYGAPDPAPGSFRRGDANGDGTLNITDPIATLDFLFAGGDALQCEDAGDSNDDGRLDISDAVTALNYLFTGTATIPAPGPTACGADSTADNLACGVGGTCG